MEKKWYDHFGIRDIATAHADELKQIVADHERSFELKCDNGYTPDPDSVDFVMVCRRCLQAEEELGRLGSVVANLTKKTENAAVTVKNKAVDIWNRFMG